MDAKDLRIESALGAHTNDGSTKYGQSGTTLQTNGNKPYHDIGSNPTAKVDLPTARPCAIIGPDRVVPPHSMSDGYLKKVAVEPWPCADNIYQHPPEYPHKPTDYTPQRNISPRQTFQENMQRIMVPPTYASVKNDDRNLKNSKSMPVEAKYCDVPYTISPINNEPKIIKNPEGLGPDNNPTYGQPVPQNWAGSGVSVRPLRPYGAPELYQYSEYPNCPAPRAISMIRPHRNVFEDVPQAYQDRVYHEANLRFKPYTTPKERPHQHPQARYDYIANYPNTFHPQALYPSHKYDLQKSLPPHPYPVYPPVSVKYLDRRMPATPMERYQRSPNQQINLNPPFCNQNIPPTYGPVPGNCMQNRAFPYPQDPTTKPMIQNRLYMDNVNARKYYPTTENMYVNDINRPHTIKSDILYPSYPPYNIHSLPPHHMYRKDSPMKGYDHGTPYRNIEHSISMNSLSRLPLQFSPQTISISPSDSNTSNDTIQTLNNAQEDCGYVSQSSTASVRSMESGINRIPSEVYRRNDLRFESFPHTNKSGQKLDVNTSSKDKKDINVRQFLQMWNEGDDEGNDNNKETSIHKDATNSLAHYEAGNNQEQLYVLGLVNVPSEELDKYEHIEKISKLPENIKGYNSIELLNQYEKLVESPNTNQFNLTPPQPKQKDLLVPMRNTIARQGIEVQPRPLSPLDVEAKISQSVIHKDVGCNFEIRPCSPQIMNVDVATPVHNVLSERLIEKVVNPVVMKSPMQHKIEEANNDMLRNSPKVPSCKMVNNQFPSPNISDTLKTNYVLHDMESNSGICLASLPRLDNDIELNFPEINQQFINANKIEAIKTSSMRDLPILDTENVSSSNKNKNNLHNKPLNSELFNSGSESDKEGSKLSKYRKHKRNSSIPNESSVNSNQAASLHRTDSVIIKNPDNAKTQGECFNNMPLVNNRLDNDIIINHANLTVEADRAIDYSDRNFKESAKEKCNDYTSMEICETAIDFSLNKSYEEQNSCINGINSLSDPLQNNVDINKNVFSERETVHNVCKTKSPKPLDENPVPDQFSIIQSNSHSLEELTCNDMLNPCKVPNKEYTYKECSDVRNNKTDLESIVEENLSNQDHKEIVPDTLTINALPPEEIIPQIHSPVLSVQNEDALEEFNPSHNISLSNSDKNIENEVLNCTLENLTNPTSKLNHDLVERGAIEQNCINPVIIESNSSLVKEESNTEETCNSTSASKFEIDDPSEILGDEKKNRSNVISIQKNETVKSYEETNTFEVLSAENETEVANIEEENLTSKKNEEQDKYYRDSRSDLDVELIDGSSSDYLNLSKDLTTNSKDDITDDKNNSINDNITTKVDEHCTISDKVCNENDFNVNAITDFDSKNIPCSDMVSNLDNEESPDMIKNNKDDEVSNENNLKQISMIDFDLRSKTSSNIVTNFENEESSNKSDNKNDDEDKVSNEDNLKEILMTDNDSKNIPNTDTVINLEYKESSNIIKKCKDEEYEVSNEHNLEQISANGFDLGNETISDMVTNFENTESDDIINNEKEKQDEVSNEDDSKQISTAGTTFDISIPCSDMVTNVENIESSDIINVKEDKEDNVSNENNLKLISLDLDMVTNLKNKESPGIINNKKDKEVIEPEKLDTNVLNTFIAEESSINEIKETVIFYKTAKEPFLKKELFSPWFQYLLLHNEGLCSTIAKFEKEKALEVNNILDTNHNSLNTDEGNIDFIVTPTLKENNLDLEPKITTNRDIICQNDDESSCSTNPNVITDSVLSKIVTEENKESDCLVNNMDIDNRNDIEIVPKDIEDVVENNAAESLLESAADRAEETNAVEENNIHINVKLCENANEKPPLAEQLSRNRFPSRCSRTLKRSLSESAIEYTSSDSVKENNENDFIFTNKRSKLNDSEILVESQMLAEDLTSFIQSNRRNSISAIYNDENVSFCILIDNDCVLTEETEDCEKICYTEIPEDCLTTICTEAETENTDLTEVISYEDGEQCEYNSELILQNEESWVDDVACMETVFNDDIAEDIEINAPSSPKYSDTSEDESDNKNYLYNVNENEHTNKVKHFYGNQMCDDDAQLVEKLYRTPQMDVNKTLVDRESQITDEFNRYYDNESLEKILSESNSLDTPLVQNDSSNVSNTAENHLVSPSSISNDDAYEDKENVKEAEEEPVYERHTTEDLENIVETKNIDELKSKEYDDILVNSCESSSDVSYRKEGERLHYAISSSPEVSSTTSEEKGSGILLKIKSYKGTKISEINEMGASFNHTHSQGFHNSNYNLSTPRPLITKAAQKYIPPLKETIRDLKVKLHLPKQSLYKLQQLKKSKEQPKIKTSHTKHYTKNVQKEIPKKTKPKPKFEDVLKSIDEIQFKMHKEKNRKSKQSIPKVIIKKNQNGAHYASTQSKETFNPDLTGRKWQPWVFLEKSSFIDKMALKQKFKAIYNHRKKTYVLAENFQKYKSINNSKSISNSKFVISHPKSSNNISTGKLKYTFRLKHN